MVNEGKNSKGLGSEEVLPERFQSPETWKYKKPKNVNPMYQTTSQLIGVRPPSKQEMPGAYYPNKSTFTRVFSCFIIQYLLFRHLQSLIRGEAV